GGTNPILVDRVGAQLLGLWDNAALAKELGGHATSPLLETAAKRFGVDIAAPQVTGDGAALLAAPRPVPFLSMAGFVLPSAPTLAAAPGPAPDPAPAPPPSPALPVAHAAPLGAGAVVLDGRADDDAWKRAPAVEWDTDYTGAPTGIHTRARFLHAPT